MSNPRDWMNGTKQKLTELVYGELIHSRFKEKTTNVSDKLPPRLQRHGISVAARVFGNEIRNFTKRTTGKDLAQIRNSKTRHVMMTKLSAIKVAITNRNTQYGLISLAYNHSTNLASSLSPEGSECDYTDFKKNNFMREFIAKYYKDCIESYEKSPEKNLSGMKKRKYEQNKNDNVAEKKCSLKRDNMYCKCNSSALDERREKSSFLSCWQHEGIKEEDLDSFLNENLTYFTQDNANKEKLSLENAAEWSHFLKTDDAVVFRRKLHNGLYEYRVQATFFDISANNLFKTQVDGNYRKTWDEYVLELDVVDADQSSSTELVHWVTKCPYPFATREYIYLRRRKIDEKSKAMILYSKSTDETDIPKENKIQRVDTYVSKIIVRPHNKYDENGCDFVLTYYDDPKMMLPRSVLDMAASRGINDSITRMYAAAMSLQEKEMEKEYRQ